jgi:hypothetical protein
VKNPHILRVNENTAFPVEVIKKGRRTSTVLYKGQEMEVTTKFLKKISADHLLPS